MKFQKKSLFGVEYAIVDFRQATTIIAEKAENRISFGVSALAVHGLIASIRDKKFGEKVNKIDMLVPDGQPIRWALNSFYNVRLKERVDGPTLTLYILEEAHTKKFNLFLYGSSKNTLQKLTTFINKNYPGVNICGIHPDRFREATPEEDLNDINKINSSNAHIVLVGRGCPRQEIWVSDHLNKIQAPMIAVGAAFDFHAGTLKQAPVWMRKSGLEWFYRLLKEPKRLWKRYLITNTHFIFLFIKYKLSGKIKKG